MADIKMQFTKPAHITYGRGFQMIQCRCGAIFEASGYPDELTAAREQWDAEHVCEPRPTSKVFGNNILD
jgi:hypothetical protein